VHVAETDLPGIKVITPVRHGDSRGFFSEIFRADVLERHGIDPHFVQENHSLSAVKGVLRGLHFQIPPSAQSKLVRVAAGAILDVAVDIRSGSPTFGRHIAIVLSAELGNQLFIPEGFAHGFCTLAPDTHLIYKVNRYYSAEHDRGLRWNDPALGINWPLDQEPVLSDKDQRQPLLADLPTAFHYE
jgi:dTDP-4-dehydrorhamnose 3,5-epimerase